jgi:DNA polymerase sigma
MSQPFGFLGLVQSWVPEKTEESSSRKDEQLKECAEESATTEPGLDEIVPKELVCRIVSHKSKAIDYGQPGTIPWLEKKSLGWKRLTIYQKLHNEILLFHEWIKPKKHDMRVRSTLFKRYEDAIKGYFGANTKVQVFGSTATNLFLPNADLDIVIVDDSNAEVLQKGQMSSKLGKLMKKIWNMSSERLLVKHARTPVLKLTDSSTKIQIDVTFNKHEKSVAAAEFTNTLLNSNEHIAPLVFVLKAFLCSRDLNSNAARGIGGYGLVLWVTAFIKIHDELYPKEDADGISTDRLGKRFLHFLHFFGHCFDYQQLGLAPLGVGNDSNAILFVRRSFSAMELRSKSSLAIMDPLDNSNNVTVNSVRIDEISHHFREALDTIVAKRKRVSWQTTVNGSQVTYGGYLSRILNISPFTPTQKTGKEASKKKRKAGNQPKKNNTDNNPKKPKKKHQADSAASTPKKSKKERGDDQVPKALESGKDFAQNLDFISL